MTKRNFDRRTMIKTLLAISSAGALAACERRDSQNNPNNSVESSTQVTAKKFLNAGEVALLSVLAQTIIPKTQTAGAVEAGVPETLQDLLSNWGDDNVRLYWREGFTTLSAELEQLAGQDFTKVSTTQRQNILGKYDDAANNDALNHQFYLDMKQTIATAYYMSEPGASEELHYDPVPGDWRGDVPFSEIGKAWAT